MEEVGVSVPTLVGTRVALRVISGADYEFIRRLEYHPNHIVTYRQRGVTVSPEQHALSLWQGVLVQFMICDRRNGKPLGLVAAFNYDARNSHVHFAVVLVPEASRKGWPLEGVALFIDYLFQTFPLRKLYSEVLEFNVRQFGSALSVIFEEEGRLREHEYYDGRYWDRLILSISRKGWRAFRSEPSSRLARLHADELLRAGVGANGAD